ncbi:RNA polymerase sigma factor [Ilumatobacter sp.]|uniref:RNA polymerase sigma factor n=1 Tax=Ilumatobacter sp. TaxID=1967498 RepID=UPI003C3D348B
MTPDDDVADVADVAERHHVTVESFDDFFASHHDRIVRALSLALGDDHLGRDAAAEGFARALQRWNRVGRYDNPTGWIYRVGLNWARSRRRKTVREISESALASELADAPDRAAESADRDLRIVPALRRLSPDHRAVVVAKYYLDWSEQRIAAALGIRPGTVKSRLSRALERLADDLRTA